MFKKSSGKIALVIFTLISLLVITACGSASTAAPATAMPVTSGQTASDTATVTASPPAPTPVIVATATIAPTSSATPAFTVTPQPPTDTPEPSMTPDLAGLPKGISGWCLPAKVPASAATDPLKPPARAQIGKIEKGALEIRNMPFSVCMFVYVFEQPAPTGLKLEIYDQNQKSPWWQTDLKPVDGKPNIVYTRLMHTYVTDPPLWNVGYEFAVRDTAGAELQRDAVNLHRWTTGLCWQGTYPDPVTLYCPLQQDLHPWDPGYGTLLPTVTDDGNGN